MAKSKTKVVSDGTTEHEFTNDLIKSINATLKETKAYNLQNDESPTEVKRFISTGSLLLDYIISNKKHGGIPEGRLVEISGPESSSKSLIALQILANTQKLGGIAIYLDTENATDKLLLTSLGIDLDKLVYIQPTYIEEVFQIIEHTIKKIKESGTDKPVTVVWDSVAATPPKAELDGDYEQNTMGLGARVIAKGLRKITQFIAENRVTLVFINQLKMKIGVTMYEDPWITPYGKAIPFHASVRLRLTRKKSSDVIDPDTKEYLGIGVKAKVDKNKIAPPYRSCEYTVGFYKGILEHEQIFNALVTLSPIELEIDKKKYLFTADNGAWHKVIIEAQNASSNNLIHELKFRKSDILTVVFKNEEIAKYLDSAIDDILTREYSKQEEASIDDVTEAINADI